MDNKDKRLEDFMKGETRCGHDISPGMKKVWACQLDLLQELKRVCEKHGLRFWLDSGSLLGAVRHKGYIPWDDDIDVCMFRTDYETLVRLAPYEFRNPYIFQTAYTERNFVRGHAQLRNRNTTAIIPSETGKRFNQGIFIDIFILDNVPDQEEEYRRQSALARRLRNRLEILAIPFFRMKMKPSHRYKAIIYRIKRPTKTSFNRLYGRYEDIFRKNPPGKEVATLAWKYTSVSRDRHIYDETILMDFEYLQMPVPRGYDNLLRQMFGDYMTPVKAPTLHGTIIFDADTPADITIRKLKKNRTEHEQ